MLNSCNVFCFFPGNRLVRLLEVKVRQTQEQAYAPGTVRNLWTQWRKFKLFCTLTGLPRYPVSDHTLALYIQFLSYSLKSPETVKQYVSGLRTLHRLLELEFPDSQSVEVKLTLRGLGRVVHHVPHQACPITVELLLKIFDVIDMSSAHDCVYYCLFLWMFFLLGRKSQFMPTTLKDVDKHKLLLRSDVDVQVDHLVVTVHWTKTLQFGGQLLKFPLIPIPNSNLCPVVAYFHMLKLVPAPPTSLMFVLPINGGFRPIIYEEFHRVLRTWLTRVGEPAAQYSSHSFRRGGTTHAFRSGVPDVYIQALGFWSSECYKGYIDMSFHDRVKAARCMVDRL